jgi:hypothetical protein
LYTVKKSVANGGEGTPTHRCIVLNPATALTPAAEEPDPTMYTGPVLPAHEYARLQPAAIAPAPLFAEPRVEAAPGLGGSIRRRLGLGSSLGSGEGSSEGLRKGLGSRAPRPRTPGYTLYSVRRPILSRELLRREPTRVRSSAFLTPDRRVRIPAQQSPRLVSRRRWTRPPITLLRSPTPTPGRTPTPWPVHLGARSRRHPGFINPAHTRTASIR